MVDYLEILRLVSLKYIQRAIESSTGYSRHAINCRVKGNCQRIIAG